MNISVRLLLLEKFETKKLWASILEQDELINTLTSKIVDYQSQNSIHLASRGDSRGVQEQELRVRADFTEPEGKKITVAQREELIKQTLVNDIAYRDAVDLQNRHTAGMDDLQNQLESAKRKYSAFVGLLRLRTAQIQFLAGEE